MKRLQSSMFAAVACALAVSASAQTTPPTGGVTQPTFGADKKVTITGCLERSKESVATGDRFMLNNIVPNAPSMTGTTGTSGSEKAPKASSYRLDGDDSKLSPHLGHKIEITGTVEDLPMSAGTPAASGWATEAPKLKVETVKMIASSCTV
jgi:hypothetical protein